MPAVFVVAAVTAVLTFLVLSRRLERKDHESAMRRLAGRAPEADEPPRRSRLRLIEASSEAPGLFTGRLLDRLRLREAAGRLLEAAALKWGPSGLVRRSVGFFVGGFLLVTMFTGRGQAPAALGAGVLLSGAPWWYARRKARRRVTAFEAQFPDCLEFVSRSMRAGHAFSVAIEMAYKEFSDPVAAEMRRTFEEQNLGQPLEIVLRKLSQRVPSLDVQFFVSAVLLQKRTGGNLAELLDKLAQLMRERFKLRARIRAVSAQGLMSGRILSAIPAAVALLMFVVNNKYARFFVDDRVGHYLVAAGLGMQLVGYLIIRKIVTFEVL